MLPDEIAEYCKRLAVDQGLVARDKYDPSVLLPAEHPTPQKMVRTVTVGGKKYFAEGATQAELDVAEINLLRELTQSNGEEQPAARDERGRFVTRQETTDDGVAAANEAEWNLKLVRGECDVATYLRETGALDKYMRENFGLDRNAISDNKFVQSWERAVEKWVNSKDAETWEGGEANQKTLQDLLIANDLVDAEDKIGALEAMYQYAKENNLLVPNPELEVQKLSRNAQFDEIRAAAHWAAGLPDMPEGSWTFDRK